MFDVSNMSSASNWFSDAQGPRRAATPISANEVCKMWVISGPYGMPIEDAKKAVGVRPGARDVVIYNQRAYGSDSAQPPGPFIVSCQQFLN